MNQCPNCKAYVDSYAKFCKFCAADLSQAQQSMSASSTGVAPAQACSNCGAVLPEKALFCMACGSRTIGSPPTRMTGAQQTGIPTLKAPIIRLGSAIGLLVSFFLPWLQTPFIGVSAYHIAQLSMQTRGMQSRGSVPPEVLLALWLIPILSVIVIITQLSGSGSKGLRVATGLVPLLFLIIILSEGGSQVLSALGVGAYLTIVAALILIFV